MILFVEGSHSRILGSVVMLAMSFLFLSPFCKYTILDLKMVSLFSWGRAKILTALKYLVFSTSMGHWSS